MTFYNEQTASFNHKHVFLSYVMNDPQLLAMLYEKYFFNIQ